jgi:DNA-binding response OmpR family regulator
VQNTPHILFVDDNEDIRFMVKAWLTRFNYEVATADSIESGLRIAQSAPFDLYLLDTRLPDGTGNELCAKIREFDLQTPIIFYSGDVPERLSSVLECGAQEVVMKPELDGLQSAIFRVMNNVQV